MSDFKFFRLANFLKITVKQLNYLISLFIQKNLVYSVKRMRLL